MEAKKYFLTIIFLILIDATCSYAQTGTISGEAAEKKLNEAIDVSMVTEALTRRALGIGKNLNRFTLVKEPAFTQLYDTYTSYILSDEIEKEVGNTLESDRPGVIILPFITAQEEARRPDLWKKSIELAKEADADFIFAGILDMANAEPIEKEGGASNVITYVGYEGSITFRLKLYNLATDQELEQTEISDKGILNSTAVKAGKLALIGSKKLSRFTGSTGIHVAANASNQVNELIDSAQPKTKAEALMQAINRSDKYLKKVIGENFPTYFPYLSHHVNKSVEIAFQNDMESELVTGHILELVTIDEGQESVLGEWPIKELSDDQFKVIVTGKKAESVIKSLEGKPQSLMAKLGKEKKNLKGKISGLIK